MKGYSLLIQKVITKIDSDLTADLSLNALAAYLNVNASYLSNLFKKEVGVSPQQYLISVRMKQALELLRQERYTVSMIAASVGYDDLFTFSRCFKKYYGVPPTAYKELQ